MKFADLHLHTLYSDGTYTPDQVASAAGRAKLSCISVCDHDTVEAIDPVIAAASLKGIEVIPGIELSAEIEGAEVHILGYYIDHKNKTLLEKLALLRQSRIERIHKMVEKLKEFDIDLDPEAVFCLAQGGTVGRLHLARALVKEKAVDTLGEAFRKYIGDKSPAYVSGFRFTPRQAIELITNAGGVAVLAHPYSVRDDALIPQFVASGLKGLEVFYPEHTQSMINFYLGLAKQYHLWVTGGSDCPGTAKPDVQIGLIHLPYEYVEALKEARP